MILKVWILFEHLYIYENIYVHTNLGINFLWFSFFVLYKSVLFFCVFMKSKNKQSTVGNPICEVLEETLAVQYVI